MLSPYRNKPLGLPLRLTFLIIVIQQTFSLAFAMRINRTIDDTYGDSITGLQVVYSGWNTGQLCPGCAVQPDASATFEGSWHDTTSWNGDAPPSATMRFNGAYRLFPIDSGQTRTWPQEPLFGYIAYWSTPATGVLLYTRMLPSNWTVHSPARTNIIPTQKKTSTYTTPPSSIKMISATQNIHWL